MRKLFLIIINVLVLSISCKKDQEQSASQPDSENILNEKAHIVDTSAVMSVTLSSLTLNKTKLTFTPSIGDIILSSPSKSHPTGVFSKIVSLSTSGNTINCSTQTSNLNEAFKQLFVDYTYADTYEKSAQLRPNNIDSGVPVPKGSLLKLPFPSNYSLTAGFTVKGILQLNIPTVQIKYAKRKGNLFPDTVLILANANTSGSSLELKANANLNVPEKTLYTFHLPTIRVPVIVAGVPLIIPFSQSVEVNTLPLNISGKMKFKIYPEISVSLGISYINGEWKNLCSANQNASAEKPIKEDFAANVTANITFFNPTYKIGPLLAENLYGFFKVPNELEGKIQTITPNYSLSYKLIIEAGIHYNFWTGLSGEKSFTIPVYSTTLKEGNFCYKIGDTAFGGIIFYIDSTTSCPNQHGMVCALTDQVTTIEYPYSAYQTWSTIVDTAIGKGKQNTNTIQAGFGTSTSNNVAAICKNYQGGGYTDWFLPSLNELQELYKHKDKVSSLSQNWYWTSNSFINPNFIVYAYEVNFSNGTRSSGFIDANVRAVRNF